MLGKDHGGLCRAPKMEKGKAREMSSGLLVLDLKEGKLADVSIDLFCLNFHSAFHIAVKCRSVMRDQKYWCNLSYSIFFCNLFC